MNNKLTTSATDPSQITFTKEDVLSGNMFTKRQLMDSLMRVSGQLQDCIDDLKFYAEQEKDGRATDRLRSIESEDRE